MPRHDPPVLPDPEVRYGIYNTAKKTFQFHICETTPEKAMQALLARIGEDARKPCFQPKPIPGYRPFPRVSTTVFVDPVQLATMEDMTDVVCGGKRKSQACVGDDLCPYKLDTKFFLGFALSDKLAVRLNQTRQCPPVITATIVDINTGKPLRETSWEKISEGHYSAIHDYVIYDVFFKPKG